MAIIKARRVEGGEGNYQRKQIVRVPKGIYGGMFARYTLPKLYQKFQSEEEELKFFAWFVLTHDRANNVLPHFSEASVTIRPKLFFSPTTDKMSTYVSFLYAMLGGKVPCEQIVDKGEYDLDEFLGRPALLTIEPKTKPDKDGLYGQRIASIAFADRSLIDAVKPFYKDRIIEKPDGGIAHLSYPSAAFQDDADADTSGAVVEPAAAEDMFEEAAPAPVAQVAPKPVAADDGTPSTTDQWERIEVLAHRLGRGQMQLGDDVKTITHRTPAHKSMTAREADRLIAAYEQRAKQAASA